MRRGPETEQRSRRLKMAVLEKLEKPGGVEYVGAGCLSALTETHLGNLNFERLGGFNLRAARTVYMERAFRFRGT